MKQFPLGKLAPLWVAIIIDSMGYGLVYPIMTLIFTDTVNPILPPGTSEVELNFYLGLSYLLYPLTMFFGASYMSDLSDRIGRKKILLISIFGLALAFFSMGLGISIHSLFLLFLGRAAAGLCAGSQPTAQAAIADISGEEDKRKNLSIMTFAITLGIILGPIFGGFFADKSLVPFFSFSTPFYLSAILAFGNFLWLYYKFEETHPPSVDKKIDLLRPIRIFFRILDHKRVCAISLIFFLMQSGFSIYYQLIQVRMATEYNYSSWDLGLFNAAIGCCLTIAMWLSLKFFLKFFSEGPIARISLFLSGIFLISVSVAERQWLIILFSIFASSFDIVAYAMIMTAFSHATGPTSQGWVMGIFGSILAISWTLTGFSTNLLSLFKVNWIILGGGISMLISAFLMYHYVKKYPYPAYKTDSDNI